MHNQVHFVENSKLSLTDDGRPDPPAGTPIQESNPGILEPSGQDLSFFKLRYVFNK